MRTVIFLFCSFLFADLLDVVIEARTLSKIVVAPEEKVFHLICL